MKKLKSCRVAKVDIKFDKRGKKNKKDQKCIVDLQSTDMCPV